MRIKVSVDKPIPTNGGEFVHISTNWQVSRVPNFTLTNQLIAQSLDDKVNLLEYRPDVDIVTNGSVYARVQYNFLNKIDNTTSSSNWSKIIPINSNQKGIKMSGTVVATPSVKVNIAYNGVDFSNLVLEGSDFLLYTGAGKHQSTTWRIKDIDGNELWSRVDEEVYLTNIEVDSSFLEADKIYLVTAEYNTDVNISSLEGKALLNTNTNTNNLFNLKLVDDLVAGRRTYFELFINVRNYASVDIIIKDNNGITVDSNLNQITRTPYIDNANLLPYHKYTILARIKLRDGSYTNYSIVESLICKNNNILPMDPLVKYLDKYDFTQELQTRGPIVTSSIELYNNDILSVKHDDNSIYRSVLCDGKLKDMGPILTIDTFKGMMEKSYFNMIPLKDGRILIDYNAIRRVDMTDPMIPDSIRTVMNANKLDTFEYKDIVVVRDITNVTNNITQVSSSNAGRELATFRPRFNLYQYNPITKVLTLENTIVRDDELYGTSPSNSIAQYGNKMYYIPTMQTTGQDSEVLIDLEMKILDLDTFVITSVPLPVKIKAYATLFNSNGSIYLAGGSSTVKTLTTEWTRDNNNIFQLNVNTGSWTNVGVFPAAVSPTIYALASYIRKDGKVIFFNNVTDGSSVGNQRTIILDPTTYKITVSDNDTPDDMIYRNAIQLQNGNIIRISTRTLDPQLVYTYISDTENGSNLTVNDTVDLILDLKVPIGTQLEVEDLHRYNTVQVEGTSDANTGELKWVKDGVEYLFHWNDLIVTRDMVIQQNLYPNQYDYNSYNSITIIDDVSLDIYNIIWVYDTNTTYNINAPVKFKWAKVASGSDIIIHYGNGTTNTIK